MNSAPPAPPAAPSRGETRALLLLFLAALAVHASCVAYNWHSGFLIGHEFRQTQTALIAHYIDEQDNFSLRYETPLFGKPWEAPLELPFYEWCVVGVKRATHWPDFEAARAVSVTFFYLLLPGLYVLLGQAGVPRARRLPALVFTLCTPVYLFYTRTFLMESTVLCFAVWFLALFVHTMRERKPHWLLLCGLSGAMAGVCKSLTLLVWLVPAAAYGAWCLGRDWRSRAGWSALARTAAWGLGCAAIPLGATGWWIRFTDAIKAGHPSAHIFTSREMSMGNFGTFSLHARLAAQTWRDLFNCWNLAVMPPWWLFAALALAVLVAGRMRRAALAAAALWFAAQMMLPYAYALQDYYFYAPTVFLAAAFGLAAHGALDARLPAWVRWGWIAVPLAGMGAAYLDPYGYRAMQRYWNPGGSGLTDALRALTPKASVIVVAGADWSAIIPFYSQRRALMIRNGLEHEDAYLERAFADLAAEDVSAFILVDGQRTNAALLRRAVAAFDLAPEVAFSHTTADVYLRRFYLDSAVGFLAAHNNFDGITPRAIAAPRGAPDARPVTIPRNLGPAAFDMVSPAPTECRLPFGYGIWNVDNARVLQAHTPTDLWVPAPAGAREIVWEFGLLASAYERDGQKTDGVEFFVFGETAGNRRQLFLRRLDPQHTAGDRGVQRASIPFEPRPGETVVFATRSGGSESFDWAYFRKIEVR